MSYYAEIVGAVTPSLDTPVSTGTAIAKAAGATPAAAAAAPAAVPAGVPQVVTKESHIGAALTLGGIIAGYMLGKGNKQKLINATLGYGIGRAIMPIYEKDYKGAIHALAAPCGAAAGAHYIKKHPYYAFAGGWVAGAMGGVEVNKKLA